jgi:hypothetical protein
VRLRIGALRRRLEPDIEGVRCFSGYAGPRFRTIGGPAVNGWIQVALGSILRIFAPAAVLTALTGVTLLLVEEAWDWDDAFV